MTGDLAALEERLWQAVKTRRFDEFRGLLAPQFVSIDDGEVARADELIGGLQGIELDEYALDGLEVRYVAPTAAVVTYSVWERLRTGGDQVERRTVATSVWLDSDGVWLLAVHHEVSADAGTR